VAEEEEDLRSLLQRKRIQTKNRLEFYREKVAQYEQELEAIRTAMTALGLPMPFDNPPTITTFTGLNDLTPSGPLADGLVPFAKETPFAKEFAENALRSASENLSPLADANLRSLNALNAFAAENASIKELVLSAFKSNRQFRFYGATSNEIREFIKDAFNREIARESLSPTLSRMRDDKLVELSPGGHWVLAEPRNALGPIPPGFQPNTGNPEEMKTTFENALDSISKNRRIRDLYTPTKKE